MLVAALIVAYLLFGYVVLASAAAANLIRKTNHGYRTGMDGDARVGYAAMVVAWPFVLIAAAAVAVFWGFSKTTEMVTDTVADWRDAYVDHRRQIAASTQAMTGEVKQARREVDEWLAQ